MVGRIANLTELTQEELEDKTHFAEGFANESRIPYMGPYVKDTLTLPKNFMPQNQKKNKG